MESYLAKQTKPTTQLDRIREVSPRYADLLEACEKYTARFDEIKREVGGNASTWLTQLDSANNIVSQGWEESLGARAVRNRSWVDETPRQNQPKPRPVVRHAGAVELLGDLLPPQPDSEVNPPPLPQAWPERDRYQSLAAEQESINEALKLLSIEIEHERKSYSKQVAEQRLAAYSERVERAVDAARSLGDAIVEIYAYLNQARFDGVELRHFKPVNLEQFGDLRGGSPLYEMIANAVQNGHVGGGKLPSWKVPGPLALLN